MTVRDLRRFGLTVAGLVLAAFVITGLVLLYQLIAKPWDAIAGVALLVLAFVLRLVAPRWARALGAVIVPTLALLGANFLWARLGWDRPDPWVGLLIACPFVGATVWVYLRSWWVASSPRHPGLWSLVVALLLVIAPVVLGLKELVQDQDPLPGVQPVSKLDVVVIGAGPGAREVRPAVAAHGWSISYWAGEARGGAVLWGEGGAPGFRQEADSVLLLAVDGAPATLEGADTLPEARWRPLEVERWLELADETAPRGTPTFALLRTRDPERLAAWRRKLTPEGKRPDPRRHGDAVSLHTLAGTRTIGDVALQLAVSAPTAQEDLALAARHRPALFFDSQEEYSTPLNIESLLRSGALRLCPDNQPVLALCEQVDDSGDLWNGPNHLAFETDELARATRDTTVYVHVTRDEGMVYLDYWWYFPGNPTYAAGGALCGAGFVIAEITCFDHQSDWEGVTVVVDPESESPSPAAVNYAAHGDVVGYSWPALTRTWDEPPNRPFAARVDTTLRPLVFVALGSHAAYPTVCTDRHCEKDVTLSENRHDGGVPWRGNDDVACRAVCLEALPTRDRGVSPALWNAYDGHWGTTECDLVVFCSSSAAPRSPAQQGRYRHPRCTDRTLRLEQGDVVRDRGTCPEDA